jgi:NAD(P)H dehydrogenase (quinone)
MKTLIVYAHHEPMSFTSALKNVSLQHLESLGHSVKVSDLYGQGFNPSAEKFDFTIMSGDGFNYMHEQKNAAIHSLAFAPDITDEINKIKEAELIIFHFPLWWSSLPAILKGWVDRVLAMGVAWDGRGQVFESGLLRGKQALVVTTAAEPSENYKPDGVHRGTVEQMLHPFMHGTLAYCGMDILQPYVVYDILNKTDEQRAQLLELYRGHLDGMLKTPNFYSKFTTQSSVGDAA